MGLRMTREGPRNTASSGVGFRTGPGIFRSTCAPVALLVTVALRVGDVLITVPFGSRIVAALPWKSIWPGNEQMSPSEEPGDEKVNVPVTGVGGDGSAPARTGVHT